MTREIHDPVGDRMGLLWIGVWVCVIAGICVFGCLVS
jgi:hypothetical protein